MRSFLSFKKLKRAVHAFMDHCNPSYVAVSQRCLARLQLVQSAAARLLTRRDANTFPRCSPHWLPVRFRIKSNILLMNIKRWTVRLQSICLTGCSLIWALRSSDLLLLATSESRLLQRGDRAFAVPQICHWYCLLLCNLSSLCSTLANILLLLNVLYK